MLTLTTPTTATETAKALNYKVGELVVLDFHRTTSESVARTTKISKTGRITVNVLRGGFFPAIKGNQERFIPRMEATDEFMTFIPSFNWGEWHWESRKHSQYIKRAYTGGSLTSLLD